ncbi:MAG TPA: sigma-54 dependent transcriptional regulator, partial [Polyangium sp.]|nr:sigma-54 dependent transcriptional regulator [Polyangium sp.]
KVNCAAIPNELFESELFGHERGSFTGAMSRKRGFFEQAHGGTLFLDEIGDMAHSAQAKVLRTLQSGEVCRVGSEHPMQVDVRVLAASNKDLEKEVAAGRFREDLYFRLAVFPLRLPALREHMEDLRALADAFMSAFCKENGIKPKRIDPTVYATLERRTFPGNVRELRNVIERAAILSGDVVTVADLPEDPHASPFDDDPINEASPPSSESSRTQSVPPPPSFADLPRTEGTRRLTLREFRDAAERRYIIEILQSLEWNISRAAVVLGVERTNLHKKIRAYDIRRG